MPSIRRSLSGRPLLLSLVEERERTEDSALRKDRGRTARTLVKDDHLRVTLVTLGPGGEVGEHTAPGPITVQPLSGRARFTVDGTDHELGVGDFLALEANVTHSVASEEGGTFLLTVTQPDPTGE